MQVQQILKQKGGGVVTVQPGSKVADAARLLSEKRIGAVIVSEDGAVPLGILSERDVVRDLGRRGPSCLEDKVDDLMTRNLISCSPQDGTESVLGQMSAGRFRHMPVMDGGKMTGLISIGDVVSARLTELAAERDALEGMVMGH